MNIFLKTPIYYKLMQLFLFAFCAFIIILFSLSLFQYPGNRYVYIMFTLTMNTLLFFGFRKNRIFFDTFIGIFLWLGFWLKFSFRIAFMDGRFRESVGQYFDYSGVAYDHALLVAICGVIALLFVSYLRGRIFTYSDSDRRNHLEGLFALYKKQRKFIWFFFVLLFVTISGTNCYFGIYQRGSIPRTQLPYHLGGIFTWLLLFGSASISAILLEFEILLKKKPTYIAVVIALLETFFSSVSLLSRGMILNAGALAIGTLQNYKRHGITPAIRYCLIVAGIFILLFGISIFTVTQLRVYQYSYQADSWSGWEVKASDSISRAASKTKRLMIDRWVGIEGAIAVSSYPKLGWDLWAQAWKEKYSSNGTSFYDLEIASSQYTKKLVSKHHSISLPGIIAFLFYPGSFLFLFMAMLFVGVLAATIEILIYRIVGSNVILTALLMQVIAYRFAHFGYVPGQSYMLFGTLGMNVLIVFLLNRYFLYFSRKHYVTRHYQA